jgi:drug/metabolite transporter (DMT)-like permease
MKLSLFQWFNFLGAFSVVIMQAYLFAKQPHKKLLTVPFFTWMIITVFFYVWVGVSRYFGSQHDFEFESSLLRSFGQFIVTAVTIYRVDNYKRLQRKTIKE